MAIQMNTALALSLADFLAVASLAASILGAPQIGRVIALGGQLLARGIDGKAEMDLLTAEVRQMVADGRAPTVDEMASWKARSDAAHQLIQNAP